MRESTDQLATTQKDSRDDLAYYLEKCIKSNLEIIVLSMLMERPMCGYDLIKDIFEKYNVFLSQGTVYPLLYSLKDDGLIQAQFARGNTRTKIYSVTEFGDDIVKEKINYFIQAEEYVLDIIRFR